MRDFERGQDHARHGQKEARLFAHELVQADPRLRSAAHRGPQMRIYDCDCERGEDLAIKNCRECSRNTQKCTNSCRENTKNLPGVKEFAQAMWSENDWFGFLAEEDHLKRYVLSKATF
jgi:hypothetical protein